MKQVLLLTCILVVWFVAAPVRSEEPVAVGEIVVEDTEEARAMQERRESSYAKTVITKKEMEELGGQTAADVLRRLPRLYFSGPPATNKDVRMAGLDKEFQNVLINGNRPPGGGEKREFALDRIPVEAIERIEILKNPTASYDADAIAGIVNVILKDPPKKRQFGASVGSSLNSIGDKAGNKVTVHYGERGESLGAGIDGVRNEEHRGKRKIVSDSVKNESEREFEKTRTITSSANLVLSYELGDRDRIVFKPSVLDQREEKDKERTVYTLSTGAPKNRNIEDETKNQKLRSYGLDWKHAFDGGASLAVSSMFSHNLEDKDKKTDVFTTAALTFNKNTFEREKKNDRETVAAVDYKAPLIGPFGVEQILSFGAKRRDKNRSVDKQTYDVSAAGVETVISTGNDNYHVDETITAYYVMDEASLADRLVVTPGVRLEVTEGSYSTAGGRSAAGDFTDWTPSFHALYKLDRGYQLRGSIARTISRPAFKDKVPTLTVKRDKIEEGNPDLIAVSSLNYEAGIERFFGKSGLLAVGAFYKDMENVIEKQQVGIDGATGLPIIKPVNVSEATVSGLEVEGKTGLAFLGMRDFTFAANYTLLHSEVRDPNTGAERRLKDQPRSLANAQLRFERKSAGFSAALGVNYIGEKIDDSDPLKPRKVERGYTQWDASFKQSLAGDLSLLGSATNIFNEKREKTEGARIETEESGVTYFLGLRYDL